MQDHHEQRDGQQRRGFALEYATLAWNVAGIVILAIAAVSARSVALAGFGLDSVRAERQPGSLTPSARSGRVIRTVIIFEQP